MFYLGPYLWIHRCVNNLNFTVFHNILLHGISGCITSKQEIRIGFKFPTLPTQRSNSPLPGHGAQSTARGMPGGDVEVSN